jgi:hypothetical protein
MMASRKLRPVGSNAMISLLIVAVTLFTLMSTMGVADRTTTDSDRPATAIVISTRRKRPRPISMASTFVGSNPDRVAVIVYVPGASDGNRNPPFASVTATCGVFVALLRASIVTPGNTPPEASLTVPSIDPRNSCAAAGPAMNMARAIRSPTAAFLISISSKKRPGTSD